MSAWAVFMIAGLMVGVAGLAYMAGHDDGMRAAEGERAQRDRAGGAA